MVRDELSVLSAFLAVAEERSFTGRQSNSACPRRRSATLFTVSRSGWARLRRLVEGDQGHEGRHSSHGQVAVPEDDARTFAEGRLIRPVWRGESLLTEPGDISNRRAPEEAAVLAAEL